MDREFLTLPEAAALVGCTRRFLERVIRAGDLKVFRPSSRIVRIRRSEFEKWVERFSFGGNRK